MNLGGRVVVLGGYGFFGKRICRALAKDGRSDVLIAGRNLERARRLAAELECEYPDARLRAIELDRNDPKFVRKLGSTAPIVVVNTAGPFQTQDFGVAEACLACRSHYVDLADGRRFVADFKRLDREARRRDALLVTGASTLPGISSAVVDALTRDMTAVDSIRTAIIPGNRTHPGKATISAVLDYCGKTVRTFENGAWENRVGWDDSRTVVIDGTAKRAAVCDVPDLELFPKHYQGIRTVTFHAGPELRWQHHTLRLMAKLVRRGLVANWSRYAGVFSAANSLTRFAGSETGYMQVEVQGTDPSLEKSTRTWSLTANQNHGPQIPCVPAIALVKKLVDGKITLRGARPCVGLIDLDDFDRETVDFDIEWHIKGGP